METCIYPLKIWNSLWSDKVSSARDCGVRVLYHLTRQLLRQDADKAWQIA